MRQTTAPKLDYRPCPGDAVDCLVVTLDDALAEAGMWPYIDQPFADELQREATRILWEDRATLDVAAEKAIRRLRNRLLPEVMCGCDVRSAGCSAMLRRGGM